MKRLVVTGTTSGIGRSIAESIAATEHHLVMAVRDVKRGHEPVSYTHLTLPTKA